MRSYKVALVIGTRPEAVKTAPVAHQLMAMGEVPLILLTGQHPGLSLAEHGLDHFPAVPLGCPGLSDPITHSDLVRMGMGSVLRQHRPAMVMVQGDTSSALGGALAAKEAGCLLAHIEAGLRTHDPSDPWPEEENRVTIDRLSDLLFAPTDGNAANLRKERLNGLVHVTGNSGIDALSAVAGPLPVRRKRRLSLPIPRRLKLLVTCHRRENWGEGIHRLCDALVLLASDGHYAIDVVMHPNPTIAETMFERLGSSDVIHVVPPLSHEAMVQAMRSADLILSDSGGIQEEAPALGVPLLVLREKTERPEGLVTGSMLIVGTDARTIVATVRRLQATPSERRIMAVPAMPFGDGNAAPRIAALTLAYLQDTEDGYGQVRSA